MDIEDIEDIGIGTLLEFTDNLGVVEKVEFFRRWYWSNNVEKNGYEDWLKNLKVGDRICVVEPLPKNKDNRIYRDTVERITKSNIIITKCGWRFSKQYGSFRGPGRHDPSITIQPYDNKQTFELPDSMVPLALPRDKEFLTILYDFLCEQGCAEDGKFATEKTNPAAELKKVLDACNC